MKSERKFKPSEVFTDEFFERMLKPNEDAMKAGLQQGRQEGERLALEEVLRDVLAQAGLTGEVTTQIAQADNSQLRAWIKSLIAGASPRQLFAGSH